MEAQKNKKHCFSWEIRFLCVGLFSVCFWSSHICFLSGISPYLFLHYFLYLLVAQTTASCQASSLLCFWQKVVLWHNWGFCWNAPSRFCSPGVLGLPLRVGKGSRFCSPKRPFLKKRECKKGILTSFFLFQPPFFLLKMALPPRFALVTTRPKCPISKITPCRRTRRHIYIYIRNTYLHKNHRKVIRNGFYTPERGRPPRQIPQILDLDQIPAQGQDGVTRDVTRRTCYKMMIWWIMQTPRMKIVYRRVQQDCPDYMIW